MAQVAVTLRMDDELRRRIRVQAAAADQSINAWAVEMLQAAVAFAERKAASVEPLGRS
jgi:predicted HicB family RNase H-like nuclease